MKKLGVLWLVILLLAAAAAAFFAGNYFSSKKYTEDTEHRFEKYISFAIDTAENKGLLVDGAAEYVASSLWVAHELCDDPQISAELSNLWNELVYEEKYAGQEDLLIDQLEDILNRYR